MYSEYDLLPVLLELHRNLVASNYRILLVLKLLKDGQPCPLPALESLEVEQDVGVNKHQAGHSVISFKAPNV